MALSLLVEFYGIGEKFHDLAWRFPKTLNINELMHPFQVIGYQDIPMFLFKFKLNCKTDIAHLLETLSEKTGKVFYLWYDQDFIHGRFLYKLFIDLKKVNKVTIVSIKLH